MLPGSDRPKKGFISKADGGKVGDPMPAATAAETAAAIAAADGELDFPGLPPLQSCACFKCCFILSGLENSFWQIMQGNTLRAAPSWYKKACLWKLYLFLKCLLICTRSHSMHRYVPSGARVA